MNNCGVLCEKCGRLMSWVDNVELICKKCEGDYDRESDYN